MLAQNGDHAKDHGDHAFLGQLISLEQKSNHEREGDGGAGHGSEQRGRVHAPLCQKALGVKANAVAKAEQGDGGQGGVEGRLGDWEASASAYTMNGKARRKTAQCTAAIHDGKEKHRG